MIRAMCRILREIILLVFVFSHFSNSLDVASRVKHCPGDLITSLKQVLC